MKVRLFAVSALPVLCLVVPAIGIAVCSLVIAVQVGLMTIRPIVARWPGNVLRSQTKPRSPTFSVHVATRNEPAHIVIATVSALLRQDWPAETFEIVVMDNNTSDPTLWHPVEAFCARQDGRVKFIHRLGVLGAKAGALNIALEHTRRDATHIVTVDADYVVLPTFLCTAARALKETGAAYVQFPQAYIGAVDAAAGIDAELEEYFRSNAQSADVAEAVLLTGTLCVISRDALVSAGGWSGETTTEDAELGVRLCNAGLSGRFINQVVGHGLLPLSFADLEKQRYRWCSGNFQTLLRHAQPVFMHPGRLNLHRRLVVITQLTAWLNLALVPAIVLLGSVLLSTGHTSLTTIAALATLLPFLDIVLRIMGRGIRGELPLDVILRALACRIALAPRCAKATFDAMMGQELKFVVTDKSGVEAHGFLRVPSTHVVLFCLSSVALIAAAADGALVAGALMFLMLPLPAAILTENSLRAYRSGPARLRSGVAS